MLSEEGKIVDSHIINSFINVEIIKQNLRCMVVFDDRVRTDIGSFDLIIEIGNIKQANDTLNRLQAEKRENRKHS